MINDCVFDPDCIQCPRLAGHLSEVRASYPDYHARPVAPFGDQRAEILIVGLAPGLHGANASGRPFTGDHAGILLYQTLYDKGLSNRPQSTSADDDLELSNCRITNAVKCLPPQNKPTGREVATCNAYLAAELTALPAPGVIFALGRIAHQAVVRALGLRQVEVPFSHGGLHALGPARWLLDSYHCSRYNTQTGRLTPAMFSEVFDQALGLLQEP
jgi:uracil-DNA glycosylase family 4